jgi:hypothetical protein
MRMIATFTLRFFLIILGCIGIAWGLWRYQLATREEGLKDMAVTVLSGGDVKESDLISMLTQSEMIDARKLCLLDVLRSRVVLRLRLAETAMSSFDTRIVEDRFQNLKVSVADFHRCFEMDGFVDLAAYWIAVNETGDVVTALPLLRKSFEHAPSEGWVIVKRVWLAFGIYDQLPDDLKTKLLNDVTRMNDARLISETGELLIHLSPNIRHQVIAHLKAAHSTSLLDLRDVVQRRAKLGVEFD